MVRAYLEEAPTLATLSEGLVAWIRALFSEYMSPNENEGDEEDNDEDEGGGGFR